MTDPHPHVLVHVAADALTGDTAQTTGMRREEAISASTVGSGRIWMGRTAVSAHTSSGPHHHGESETAIYVVEGNPRFRFRDPDGTERVIAASPGDYVFVPPWVHHVEENPHDTEAVVVIARSTQEAIVENVEAL